MTKPNKFLAVLLSCVLLLSAISAPASASGIGGGGYSGSCGRCDWSDVLYTIDQIMFGGYFIYWKTTQYYHFYKIPSLNTIYSKSSTGYSSYLGSGLKDHLTPSCDRFYYGCFVNYTIPNGAYCNYSFNTAPFHPSSNNEQTLSSSPGYCFSPDLYSVNGAFPSDIYIWLYANKTGSCYYSIEPFIYTPLNYHDVPVYIIPSDIDDDLFTGIGGKIPNNNIIDTTEKKIYSPRQETDISYDVDSNLSYDYSTYTYTYIDTSNNITYNITYGDDKVVYSEQYTENGDIINYTYNYYYSDPTLSPGDTGNTGISGLLDNFWSWLGELLSSLWDFILDIVGDLFTLIKSIIQGFLSIFTITVTEIITALGNFFTYYTDGTLYDFSGVT